MSDLSRLLEDVYRRSQEPASPVPSQPDPVAESGPSPAAPANPSWSSDDTLESVFADWVPGPTEAAPAVEHAIFAELLAETEAPTPISDDSDPYDLGQVFRDLDPAPTSGIRIVDLDLDDALVDDVLPDDAQLGAEVVDDVAVEVTPLRQLLDALDEPPAAFEFPSPAAATISSTLRPAQTLTPAAPVGWRREDDDILPSRSGRRTMSLRLRR